MTAPGLPKPLIPATYSNAARSKRETLTHETTKATKPTKIITGQTPRATEPSAPGSARAKTIVHADTLADKLPVAPCKAGPY